MSASTALGGRVAVSRRTVGLAVGDVLCVLGFVVAGEIRHYSVAFVRSSPDVVLATALPFLIGWALAAPAARLYDAAVRGPGETAGRTAGAWLIAALIGQALRATPLFRGGFSPAFVAVSVAVGLALLVPWRLVAAVLVRPHLVGT